VSANAPIVDVVDINTVRLVVNVIEKDLKQISAGDAARVEVDAFPGEDFPGRIARVAPVLDPATRTASVEIEIQNPQYRLKPGMYARVGIVTDSHSNALVVPTNALVDLNGTRGVYVAANNLAAFHPVKTGIEGPTRTEILDGIADGDRVVTTGAAGLRNGDPIVLAGGQRGGAEGGGRQAGRQGARENGGNAGRADANASAGQANPGQREGQASGVNRRGGTGDGTGTGRRGGVGGQRQQQQPAATPQAGPETR